MTLRRTVLPLAITLALSLAACQPAGTPPAEGQGPQAAAAPAEVARPSRQYGIEEFIESTGVGDASFSADESRILFSSNKTGNLSSKRKSNKMKFIIARFVKFH